MADDITWNGKWGGQPTQSDALREENEQLRAALHDVDELCQQGLNSPEPVHWEATLQDIMELVRAATRLCLTQSNSIRRSK